MILDTFWTFGYVFEEVLNQHAPAAMLDVDVCVKSLAERLIVRNYIPIIQRDAIFVERV
jgi:hypothetical protein